MAEVLDLKRDYSPRYSLPIPIQHTKSPRASMSDEQDEARREKRNTRLLQFIYNQQQQYDNTMQLTALRNEVNFLTEKLIHTEEKVCKWKREFKDLHTKFIQVVNDHTATKEELEDTRRMLAESEHIRSRWFLKKPQGLSTSKAETLPKKSSKKTHVYHRYS